MASAEVATAPELSSIHRVRDIPLVASTFEQVRSSLSESPYTRSPYLYAEDLSKRALSYTESLQIRLAPLLVRADGLANMGLDAIESRYPYPFKTPTEDIIKDIKGQSDHAYDVANKAIDERVKSPALSVAQGIDSRLTPLVNLFEAAVNKVHPPEESSDGSSPSEAPKFQYQRALALSKGLSDQLYSYSTEQVNQLKAQSALVQKAAEAAHKVSEVASTSYGAAQDRVHGLSDVMVQELQKVQTSTSHLPEAIQTSFHDITSKLSSTIQDLTTILNNPQASVGEKVQQVRDTVTQRVQPILEASAARIQELVSSLTKRASEKGKDAAPNGTTNGRA